MKLSRAFPEHGIDTDTLHFDFAVYALGSHLPSPLNLWSATLDGKPPLHAYGGTKAESIAWLKDKQQTIEAAATVLIVGGGALGIRACIRYYSPRIISRHHRIRDGHRSRVPREAGDAPALAYPSIAAI